MDKDVLVQYYVLVDKYRASRTRNYQQHKIDAMLVRGSLQQKRGFNYLTQEVCNLQKD
jgi:hypothetical protein